MEIQNEKVMTFLKESRQSMLTMKRIPPMKKKIPVYVCKPYAEVLAEFKKLKRNKARRRMR
jgi:hypothetical protein